SNMSDASAGSKGSSRSLCSQGIVNPSDLKATESMTICKPAATWTEDEETAFFNFLLENKAGAGAGGFKLATYNSAVIHLSEKFPMQTGGHKLAQSCKCKWTSLKKSYEAVVDIKNTSGFTWNDQIGAGIQSLSDDIWIKYCKSHLAGKPFCYKSFPHFAAAEVLVPCQGKGAHVY
ncbi:hypothetical protein PAXRUDRAFT_54057, partial [Paxillus rubicundulus Ve08.2h10]